MCPSGSGRPRKDKFNLCDNIFPGLFVITKRPDLYEPPPNKRGAPFRLSDDTRLFKGGRRRRTIGRECRRESRLKGLVPPTSVHLRRYHDTTYPSVGATPHPGSPGLQRIFAPSRTRWSSGITRPRPTFLKAPGVGKRSVPGPDHVCGRGKSAAQPPRVRTFCGSGDSCPPRCSPVHGPSIILGT